MSDGPQADAAAGSQTCSRIPARAKFYLCASYALAAWAWRSWEFIVALVLIELYPNSLLMVSAYGLLDNLARVLLGPPVGSYVDRHERLPGAHAMLRLQNLCIGGSAAAALALLWPGSAAAEYKASYWSLMWLLTVLGASSSAGSTGVSIAVEREAVKALCGDDGRALAGLNAVMRAIDLSALLCAPLAAGLLMTAAGPFAAAGAMAVYCGGAYVPEVLLLGAAFRAAPVLGRPKVRVAGGEHGDERTGLLAEYGEEANSAGGAADGIAEDGAAGKHPPGTATAAAAATISSSPLEAASGDCSLDAARSCLDSSAAVGELHLAGRAPGAFGRQPAFQDSPAAGCRLDRGVEEDHADGRESARLGQPLLLGPTDSMASWGVGSAEDGSPDPTPGHSPGAHLARGTAGGDSFRSNASSMPALAVSTAAGATTAATGGGSGGAAVRSAVARQAAVYGASWVLYWRQPVLLLCLALALLYMTVLSLGFLMTSFLKWSGLSEAEVSGYRGVGALAGLAATAIFPPLSARAGLRFCAVAGVTYQLACLAAGVLPVAAAVAAAPAGRPSTTQVRILVVGLVSSRTGLWLYDLAVTQFIQEQVRQDQLGAVYGVQSSLQAVFEMLSFVAGLVSPDPARFMALMLASLGSVASAAVLVWWHACCAGRGRRHAAGTSSEAGGGGGGASA